MHLAKIIEPAGTIRMHTVTTTYENVKTVMVMKLESMGEGQWKILETTMTFTPKGT